MMVEGAVFDMDGVLVDNVNYHLRAWQAFGREHGRELTEKAIRATFGQRNREMMQKLLERTFSEEELRQYGRRKEDLYREIIGPELKAAAVSGLNEFLRELKGEGFQIAVATSGPRENVNFVLDGLDIRSFFGVIVTGAEVTRGKPNPEIFLLAAERLGMLPGQCVVFEDSSSGIEAAQRAGCYCVAVATTHPIEELRELRPHLIVTDFLHLRAARMRELSEAPLTGGETVGPSL